MSQSTRLGSLCARVSAGAASPCSGPSVHTYCEVCKSGGAAKVFRRLERWALQSVARSLLRSLEWRRFCNCCRVLQDGRAAVEVWYRPGASAGSYGGLQHCGSVWVCAVCSARITEHRSVELGEAFAALRRAGGSWALLTLTFRHGSRDAYAVLDDRLADALRHFRNSWAWKGLKARGLQGTVTAYEVTWGPVYGWHPHKHLLLAFSGAIPSDLLDVLYTQWEASTRLYGLSVERTGFSLGAAVSGAERYVAKWGKEPAADTRMWGIESELTRGASKSARSGDRFSPPDLLRQYRDTGEVVYRDRYREYASVTRGRSQLRFSPGLRLLLGLGDSLSDSEVVDTPEHGSVLLGSLSLSQWHLVLSSDRRAELLEVASQGWEAVLSYVGSLVRVEVA